MRQLAKVVISCMALAELPDLDWGPDAPGFIQWSGAATGGHPDWSKPADQMRKGGWRKGRMLPTLLARYGFDAESRVALVGFSAGANSGVRELLRNAEDRAQIDAVFQVDGMHPLRRPRPKTSAAKDQFAAYPQQVEFLAEYAADAAAGGKLYVQSTSQVGTPSPGVFATWEAMPLLEAIAEEATPPRMQTAPAVPGGFPNATNHARLDRGEPYPRPMAVAGLGNFVQLHYSGAGKRAHQLQAWIVAPDMIREFLAPRWKRGEV